MQTHISQKDKDSSDLQQMVLDLINDLNQLFTSFAEQADLTIVTFFFRKMHPDFVMKHAVKKLVPHKEHIEGRNIMFFDKNISVVFSGLPEERVLYYRNEIMTQKRISKANMKCIFDYLEAMIALAEPYKNDY